MSRPPMTLRMFKTIHGIRITVRGTLDAATSHMLGKAVVAVLRHYPTPALNINLKEVTEVDVIGVCALRDSQREAQRRGIRFRLTDIPPTVATTLQRHSADLLPDQPHRQPLRRPVTGALCRNTLRRIR